MSISNIANLAASPASTATPVQPAQKVVKPEPVTKDTKLSPKELSDIVRKANKALEVSQSSLKFQVDPDNGQTVVQVIDQDTQQVIKQIPSVEMLKLAKELEKMQGVLMSQKA
ncbi:flagellar protein FlaG [Limnobacter litoralis]|uniref:Flagellar protein FlaG n=1 Tax=Limnobacter litoralis TaxID=481366 RepID=A0ABQ5YSR1_9BURK|nr:flagellar protein FlaG [Limnobacter litoralis]GLR27669.1 hypothetical protein GCM10007875_27600 [Limnobacter litoralis]